MLTLVRSIVSR